MIAITAAVENRALASYDKKDFDRAIADFSSAIELDPASVDAYRVRGNAYAEKGNLINAMTDYDKALSLDPTDAIFMTAGSRSAAAATSITPSPI